MVREVAGVAVRRLLRTHGVRASEADDVLQDLFLYLQRHRCGPLKTFRGATEAEFRGYLWVLTLRFTVKWCRKQKRQEQPLGTEIWDILLPPDRRGPTEEEFEARWQELYAAMSPKDRSKLTLLRRFLHGQAETGAGSGESSRQPISERTLRHWSLELYRKYRHLF